MTAIPAGDVGALEVRDLTVTFETEDRPLRVVDGVSITLAPEELTCIVGESGSGKSVTMLSVMRLLDADVVTYGGQVRFDGRDLLQLSQREMQRVRGSAIAMIFQDPMTALNPVYRIGWQITEQLRAHEDITASQGRARALELLRLVGISDPDRRIDSFPHELSGGMRQRVMIALALSCRPKVLIADEPTTALDVTIQAQILELIKSLQEQTGMSVALVTHDMGVVAEVADRVYVMYGGRVVESGSVEDIFDDPRHPYTWGLLGSIPRLYGERPHRLPSIDGTPAVAGRTSEECVFAPRCSRRFEPCVTQPPLFDVTTGHAAACHLVNHRDPDAAADGAV